MTRVEERLSELLAQAPPEPPPLDVMSVVAVVAQPRRYRMAGVAGVAAAVAVAVLVPLVIIRGGVPGPTAPGTTRILGGAVAIQQATIYIDRGANETFGPPSQARDNALGEDAIARTWRRLTQTPGRLSPATLSASEVYLGTLNLRDHANHELAFGLRSKDAFRCLPPTLAGAPPADPTLRCVRWTFLDAADGHLLDSTSQQLPDVSPPTRTTDGAAATRSVRPRFLPPGVRPAGTQRISGPPGVILPPGFVPPTYASYRLPGAVNRNTERHGGDPTRLHPSTSLLVVFNPNVHHLHGALPPLKPPVTSRVIDISGNKALVSVLRPDVRDIRIDWVDADGYHEVGCEGLTTSQGLSGLERKTLIRIARSLYTADRD